MKYIPKPQWSTAPGWAQYLAQDSDGTWCWYQNKPELDRQLGVWEANADEFVDACRGRPRCAWADTLEHRPE